MLGRHIDSALVVATSKVVLARAQCPNHHHQRDAPGFHFLRERAGCSVRGTKHDTGRPLLPHGSQDLFLPINVFIRVRHQHDIVLMAHTNEDVDRQEQVLRTMREQGSPGIVLCPAYGTPRTLTKEVEAWGIPLVVMVRTLGPGKYDFAGGDNERGIYVATKHLLDAGHERIGFLGGLAGVVLEQRLNGFRTALAERKLKFDEELVVRAKPTRQSGYETMCALLDIKPRPTAAVCYNDVVAFGARSALGEGGMEGGRDFALTGFDNVQDAAHSNPPLTTVDIRPGALGEQAASILLSRIQTPGQARQMFLAKPQLVVRKSTGAVA